LALSDAQLDALIAKGGSAMTKKYRSEALAAVHEMMEGLREVGAIDKRTMRDFDETCLSPVEDLAPEEIKAIREREHVSQPVFARYLNVSKNLVSDWERGAKRPGGPALRLLTLVRKKGLQAIA
jgi:putative transcriptional regulator